MVQFVTLVWDFHSETGRFPGRFQERLQELVQRYQDTYGGLLAEALMNHTHVRGVTVEQVRAAYQEVVRLGMLADESEYMEVRSDAPTFQRQQQVRNLLGRIGEEEHANAILRERLAQAEADFTQAVEIAERCSERVVEIQHENTQLKQRKKDYNNKWWFQKMFTWSV